MQILQCQHDLRRIEARRVVGEAAHLPQLTEQLPSDDVLHEHVQVALVLEVSEQVNDERMADARQDGLLGFDVLDLLQSNDLTLLQHLQREMHRLL